MTYSRQLKRHCTRLLLSHRPRLIFISQNRKERSTGTRINYQSIINHYDPVQNDAANNPKHTTQHKKLLTIYSNPNRIGNHCNHNSAMTISWVVLLVFVLTEPIYCSSEGSPVTATILRVWLVSFAVNLRWSVGTEWTVYWLSFGIYTPLQWKYLFLRILNSLE